MNISNPLLLEEFINSKDGKNLSNDLAKTALYLGMSVGHDFYPEDFFIYKIGDSIYNPKGDVMDNGYHFWESVNNSERNYDNGWYIIEDAQAGFIANEHGELAFERFMLRGTDTKFTTSSGSKNIIFSAKEDLNKFNIATEHTVLGTNKLPDSSIVDVPMKFYKAETHPTRFDGQYFCYVREVEECGAVHYRYRIVENSKNVWVVNDNQTIIAYASLPDVNKINKSTFR